MPDALLAARSVLHREFKGFERRVRSLARRDDRARLLMSARGALLVDRHRVALPGHGDDLGFFFMIFGVQHRVLDTLFFQFIAKALGNIN